MLFLSAYETAVLAVSVYNKVRLLVGHRRAAETEVCLYSMALPIPPMGTTARWDGPVPIS